MDAALADALELIRLGKWPEPPVSDDHLEYDDQDDEITIVTPEMKAEAITEAIELIRQGKWPADYEDDDPDDSILPPAPSLPLKAAE